MVEEYLDQYIYSMELFTSQSDAVDWLEDREGEMTLVIMPRLVTDILREKLFSSKTPIVFSSATLSVQRISPIWRTALAFRNSCHSQWTLRLITMK